MLDFLRGHCCPSFSWLPSRLQRVLKVEVKGKLSFDRRLCGGEKGMLGRDLHNQVSHQPKLPISESWEVIILGAWGQVLHLKDR